MRFAIVITQDEKGYFAASCPAFPGCHSQGHNREEALANITEAIQGYIESLHKHGEPVPNTDVAAVEVTA